MPAAFMRSIAASRSFVRRHSSYRPSPRLSRNRETGPLPLESCTKAMRKSPTQTPVMSISMPACGYETLSSTGAPRASPKRFAAASTSLEATTTSWILKLRSAMGSPFLSGESGVACNELAAQDLPVRAARQLGDEEDPRRDLVRGDPFAAVIAQGLLLDFPRGDNERD